jgi:hypothetical protein
MIIERGELMTHDPFGSPVAISNVQKEQRPRRGIGQNPKHDMNLDMNSELVVAMSRPHHPCAWKIENALYGTIDPLITVTVQ